MDIVSIILIALFVCLLVYPYFKIIGRTGLSKWWGILAFIPVVNLIMLWVFVFVRWPAVDGKTEDLS